MAKPMNAYFVRVFNKAVAGERERSLSTWLVCANSAGEAVQILSSMDREGREIQGVNKAPEGTAERYKLMAGKAAQLI